MEENKGVSLEDKCRAYQKRADYYVNQDKYILAHIDGRSFSKHIKNKFKKPFDDIFINAMNKTAQYLCANVQGAQVAYVQSDEISLLIKKRKENGEVFFGGRLCKMQSIIAGLATAKFNQYIAIRNIEEKLNKEEDCDLKEAIPLYQFDCKVWDVDNANDAWAWFLFRNIDCVKNSKQQTAQTYIPHKRLLNKTADEQIEIAKEEKGVDWHSFSDDKKYGRLVVKEIVERFTMEGFNPGVTQYTRSVWNVKPLFDLTKEGSKDKFYEIVDCLKDGNKV